MSLYTYYLEFLYENLVLVKRLKFKLFFKIKKLFKYAFIQCIKMFKHYKNKKYFLFSFHIKIKKTKLQKSSNYLLKKKMNLVFILNNILFNLLLFLIKNWLDQNIFFLAKKNNILNYNNNNNIFNENKKKLRNNKKIKKLEFFKFIKKILFLLNYNFLFYYLNKGFLLKKSVKKLIYKYTLLVNKKKFMRKKKNG